MPDALSICTYEDQLRNYQTKDQHYLYELLNPYFPASRVSQGYYVSTKDPLSKFTLVLVFACKG